MRAILLVCALALTGCASTWTKSGVSKEQASQALASCEASGLAKYPVNVVMMRIEGTQSPASQSCDTVNGKPVCTSVPGSATPSMMQPNDTNLTPRNAAVEACMRAEGFSRG